MSARQSHHWAAIGERSVVAGMWFMYYVQRFLGRWPLRICLYPVVLYYWASSAVARKASRQYLQRIQNSYGAIGERPGRRHELRHFLSFAEVILDKMLAVGGRYRFDKVRYIGREAVIQHIRAGQGGVFMTAHIGCLELCQATAEHQPGLKLNVLVHTRHAQRWNRMLQRLSPDRAIELLQVSEVSAATAVMLEAKVAQGEFIAIAADRVPVTGGRTVRAPFLGHEADFPIGPYVLASLLKCPVFLMCCVHEGAGYAVHFEQLAERIELPRRGREAALAGYAADFSRRIETRLVHAPYDWFNFYPFWASCIQPSEPNNNIDERKLA